MPRLTHAQKIRKLKNELMEKILSLPDAEKLLAEITPQEDTVHG